MSTTEEADPAAAGGSRESNFNIYWIMRVNENTVLRGQQVLLVPYESHNVPRYHEWMKSEELQKLTASEPLTLEQEYGMQLSWREDVHKCTFIIPDAVLWDQGCPEQQSMMGDVNLFLTEPGNPALAEIEVMIAVTSPTNLITFPAEDCKIYVLTFLAYSLVFVSYISGKDQRASEPSFRGRGLGEESVRLMLSYGITVLGITIFEAKIGQENLASIRLFKKLHFQEASVSEVFQEVTLRWEVTEQEKHWIIDSTPFQIATYSETKLCITEAKS